MGIDQAALLPSFAWASGIDEHSRNKERHKSMSVESRLAEAALLRSTVPPGLRSMRHGCRARELEGAICV